MLAVSSKAEYLFTQLPVLYDTQVVIKKYSNFNFSAIKWKTVMPWGKQNTVPTERHMRDGLYPKNEHIWKKHIYLFQW